MPIPQSEFLRGISVPIGKSVFFSPGLIVDLRIDNKRYLQAGNVENDSSKFDTSIFGGGFAGSNTPSTQGDAVRYVRIS